MADALCVTQVKEACLQITEGKRTYEIVLPSYRDVLPIQDFKSLSTLRHAQFSSEAQDFFCDSFMAFIYGKEGRFSLASEQFPLLFSAGGVLYRTQDFSGVEGYLFVSRTDDPRLSLFAGRSSSIEEIFDPLAVAHREGLEECFLVQGDRLLLPEEIADGVPSSYCTKVMEDFPFYLEDEISVLKIMRGSEALNPDSLSIQSPCSYGKEIHGVVSWDFKKAALDFIRVIPLELDVSSLWPYDLERDHQDVRLERDHVFVPLSTLEAGKGACFRINSWRGLREEVKFEDYNLGYTARKVLSRFHTIP